jgi:hypothetical protein
VRDKRITAPATHQVLDAVSPTCADLDAGLRP